MEFTRNPTTLVRMLVSEQDELFVNIIVGLTHGIAKLPITIASIIPGTNQEQDLLETAARQKFDLAVLFLNNIVYSSGDRDRLMDDSVALIQKMVRLFRKPIIALSGWPDSPDYFPRIIQAGATAVFRMPWDHEDLQQALKRCINIW